MDGIYTWIQNLAFYFILMTMVSSLLPGSQYIKYVKFFMGLVLVVLLASPILQLFHMDGRLADSLVIHSYEQELAEFREQEQELESRYSEKMQEKVKAAQEQEGDGDMEGKKNQNSGMKEPVQDISIGIQR